MSLRILLLGHHRLNREQGAAGAMLGLAEELRRLGQQVTTFDRGDADRLESGPGQRITGGRLPLDLDTLREFSHRARAFVRRHADAFDVIDAYIGDLPFSKRELGFSGLLVARTQGLYFTHQQVWKHLDERYPARAAAARREKESGRYGWPGRLRRRALSAIRLKFEERRYVRSLRTCDLVSVQNPSERAYIEKVFGRSDTCVEFADGIAHEALEDLARAARPSSERLARRQVVFIGAWVPSKGAWDWAAILAATRARVPDARFLFLGTSGYADGRPERVLRDLECPPCEWIEVVPRFAHHELAQLVAGATVGAFPSYAEGSAIAVREVLAAGVPSVVYDISPMRELMAGVEPSWMVPNGNTEQFVDRLAALLTLDPVSYERASTRARAMAATYTMRDAAEKRVATYLAHLALRPSA